MIEETIARIEERLRAAESLAPERRQELEELLAQLRREAAGVAIECGEPAGADEDARSAVNRLESSLTEFEASHPQLVGLVNRISTVLANMGI